MKCEEIKNNMTAFLEGELSGEDEKLFRAHIDSCSQCREEIELHRETWNILGEWKDIEPSPSFTADFWEAVEKDPEALAIGKETWWQRMVNIVSGMFTFRVPAWGVVSLLMVAVFIGHFAFPRVEEKVVVQKVPEVQVVYRQVPTELLASLPTTNIPNTTENLSTMSEVVDEAIDASDISDLPEPSSNIDMGSPLDRIDLDFLMEGTQS